MLNTCHLLDRIEKDLIFPMTKKKNILIILTIGIIFLTQGAPLMGQEVNPATSQYQRVMEWRKERDEFFKTHEQSPLTLKQKRIFKGLKYYPFNPQYIFSGQIERYSFYINDPKYYAIILTNRGTSKRYIRYGKFHFKLNNKEYAVEIYKSILSDFLFLPFKDKTNGTETYEGGRYIDAEILVGYNMVLDFNMAYHPPCAYNNQLTCALPPRENMLDIPIRAGEKRSK
jgi:uncharacterized protein (DUF1684 family)